MYLLPPATKLGQGYIYRPQRSCEGYVFTGMCLFTWGGGCLPQCMLGYQPPEADSPPGADPPPRRDGHCCGWYACYWNAFLFHRHLWFCPQGGMHGCRGCVVVGGCAWLWGHAWLWGACVVAGGVHGCGGHTWLWGGMHGCGGACMVAGGHAWLWGVCMVVGVMPGGGVGGVVRGIRRDTVNERAVRILLECILVLKINLSFFPYIAQRWWVYLTVSTREETWAATWTVLSVYPMSQWRATDLPAPEFYRPTRRNPWRATVCPGWRILHPVRIVITARKR